MSDDGSYCSDGSKIGYGYLPAGSTLVEMFDYDFLPSNNPTEDARKFNLEDNCGYDGKYLFCNQVASDGLPYPAIYKIEKEDRVSQLIASAGPDHILSKSACKSFMLLPKDHGDQETFAITRPWYGFNNYGNRSNWLMKLNQPRNPTQWLDCEPVKVLIPLDPDFAVVGISTVAKISEGILLFWHKVTSFMKHVKQYIHYVSLLDFNGNEIKRSREPFLTTQDFPECQNPWVPGALYFTNVHINKNKFWSIVTVGDTENYLIEGSLDWLRNCMENV
jgi:hypothetical protein